MKTFTKVLIWFFSILFVLLIGLYIVASVTVSNFKPRLENILSDEIGYQTKINGDLSLKLLPGVSFIVSDLRVINNETYLVRVEKAELTINGRQLLNSVFEVTGLTLEKPQVFFDYDNNGLFNFDVPDAKRNGKPVKTGTMRQIALRHLTIRDGRLIYFDYQHGDTLIASGIDVNSNEVNISSELNRLNAKSIHFSGPVNIRSVRLNKMRLDSILWKLDIRSGKAIIQTRSDHYFEGKQNGRILIDFTGKPYTVNIQSHIAGLDIGEFREAAHLSDVFFGNLDYDIEIGFRSFNWSRALKSMNGKIKISGKKMLLQGISLDNLVKEYKNNNTFDASGLAALFIAGPFGEVFTKNIQFAPLQSEDSVVMENITRLVSNWSVHNGIARAEDVAFTTDRYRLALTGSLDLAGGKYDEVMISMLNKFGCPVIGLQMNGLFQSPEYEVVSNVSKWNISVDSFWKDMANSTRKNCNSIYSGSVKPPVVK